MVAAAAASHLGHTGSSMASSFQLFLVHGASFLAYDASFLVYCLSVENGACWTWPLCLCSVQSESLTCTLANSCCLQVRVFDLCISSFLFIVISDPPDNARIPSHLSTDTAHLSPLMDTPCLPSHP